ncbi:MAG: polysaccharide biosynthesis C-terminal domain-containing protein, partial [Candidatus Aminicenantes bacterium]|nr:polysaccharide biosynthesis C-terminal domain-containing protein [Candidatus Aminicenantes bacterium]
RQEIKKMGELFKVVTKWIFTISFPVFLVMVLFPRMILDLWGKDFASGAACLILMSCAQLINCGVGSSGYMLMMTGHTKIILLNSLFLFAMTIGLSVYLIPEHGMLGAALSYAIPIGLINIVRLVEVYVILGIHPYRWDFLKPLTAGLSALVVAWIVNNFVLIDHHLVFLAVNIFAVALTYGLVLVVLRIPQEDRIVLDKIKLKLFTR